MSQISLLSLLFSFEASIDNFQYIFFYLEKAQLETLHQKKIYELNLKIQ